MDLETEREDVPSLLRNTRNTPVRRQAARSMNCGSGVIAWRESAQTEKPNLRVQFSGVSLTDGLPTPVLLRLLHRTSRLSSRRTLRKSGIRLCCYFRLTACL